MVPDFSRLTWALGFAQDEGVGQWKDGDWLNALEDALTLIGCPKDRSDAVGVALRQRFKVESQSVDRAKALLGPLQARLWKFIEMAERCSKSRDAAPLRVSFRGECVYDLPGQRTLYIPKDREAKSAFETALLLRVGDLLTRENLARLKRCPECQRLFLAIRKQLFDTYECSSRYRVRNFRRAIRPSRLRRGRRRTQH